MRLAFATGGNGEFANNGKLPWGKTIKEDMIHFTRFCEEKVLIMGYKTWLSMPDATKIKYKMLVLFNRKDDVYHSFTGLRFVLNNNQEFISFLEFLRDCEEGLDHKTEYCVVGGAGFVELSLQNLDVFDQVLYTNVLRNDGNKFQSDRNITMSLIDNIDNTYEYRDVSSYDNDGYKVVVTQFER